MLQPIPANLAIPSAPAPWKLTGNGYVLLYRFKTAWLQSVLAPLANGLTCDGGFGSLMLVDYHNSPVGAYRELLFIPAQFRHANQRYFSITHIFVSTWASVVNGRDNWGIPKNQADFTIEPVDAQTERITVTTNGQSIAEWTLRTRKGLRLPINTRWLPYRPTLIQTHGDQYRLTAPYGAGTLQLATLEACRINAQHFPDVSHTRPLLAMKFSNFQLNFPPATLA